MALMEWALPQMSKLLPLDQDSLSQVITYSASLPKDASAEHLKNLLGDSSAALEFISSFNSRRQGTALTAASSSNAPANDAPLLPVPKVKKSKKKASDLHKLPPPRQVDDNGLLAAAYRKKDDGDYMAGRPKDQKKNQFDTIQPSQPSASTAPASPKPATPPQAASPKLPPSASGRLISDLKSKAHPKPKAAKVTITGGTPMHGQSTALSDLDSAIRALEIQTNPTLAPTPADTARRRCACMATRHALLTVAPNCLHCGKIICAKEGLGPCTFCGTPLLSRRDIDAMMRVLREERGKEKTAANNAAHRRAEVARSPRPFAGGGGGSGSSHQPSPVSSAPPSDAESDKLTAAKMHRDKLLAFQANNAKRTRIHDEVADFETPNAGQNMWASPAERAMQLKKQQKALREQEWNARPEWEKRRVVASIDLAGGKVVRKMAAVERPRTPEDEEEEAEEIVPENSNNVNGTFGRNPLLRGLIRPIARIDVKGKGKAVEAEKGKKWRRVQDDNDNNEQWILDGGQLGTASEEARGTEEPACG